jgi:hypothetical protein
MTNIKASTLRPGLLVSLKTSVAGNVSYLRQDIDKNYKTEEGQQKAKWETERTITDPVEYEAAQKVRNKISAIIRGVCANSAFGLLCPESDADKLDAAIKESIALADAFNDVATITRVKVYVLPARIAQDDVSAMQAINSEVSELMETMQQGIANVNAKQVREATSRLRSVGMMLSPDMQARVQLAMDAAKSAARQIVKAGEQAAQQIDQSAIRRIAEQRTAFLDLDDVKEVAAPTQRAVSVDFDTAKNETEIKARSVSSPQLELE